ncbi:2-hydroxyacid dehydrogenase [uncultured Aquimarina sp.]|uniref:2-hydroxyacid dehydrogenase n=1 Tax=uncultured Aquimarina sp. TaxID=575652 RepID=UPI002637BA69|nr:2-hydroxyacid dehydrogenase [uncultured Aquimarina sp.]
MKSPMKILIYSAKDFEIPFLEKANKNVYQIKYIPERLTSKTAMMALGFDVVSIFSADDGTSKTLELLKEFGIKHITLRSAGYDNIHLKTAQKLGIKVANTPDYSPNAIAEHAIALLLALNRKLMISNQQFLNYNFSLSNLIGFDLYNKTVGIIGTGRIGKIIATILVGFGCKVIATDTNEDSCFAKKNNIQYVSLEDLCQKSDVIMLSVPLNSTTHYMINTALIKLMKREVYIINIARGAIVKTLDLIEALKWDRIAAYAADVYEYEHNLFFYDHSNDKPDDSLLQQLIDLPNVLMTPHQAFATTEALTNIAETTFYNIDCWQQNKVSKNELFYN